MDFEAIKPKLARGLRSGSWLISIVVGVLFAGHGLVWAALCGVAVWIAFQVLAMVVESVVIRGL